MFLKLCLDSVFLRYSTRSTSKANASLSSFSNKNFTSMNPSIERSLRLSTRILVRVKLSRGNRALPRAVACRP